MRVNFAEGNLKAQERPDVAMFTYCHLQYSAAAFAFVFCIDVACTE